MVGKDLKESVAKIKENLFENPDWDKVEVGLMLASGLNNSQFNAELLDGCRIDKDGKIHLNAFLIKNKKFGAYIFLNILLLSPQYSKINLSLKHENINKLIIDLYRPNSFPDGLSVLNKLEELKIDIDYSGIPDQIFQLKKLKSVYLNSKFMSIPNEISALENLESFTLKPAIKEFLKGFKGIKKLKHLDIDCSYSSDWKVEGGSVSDHLLGISDLRRLHLRSCNPRIPKEFDELLKNNYKRSENKKINVSFEAY